MGINPFAPYGGYIPPKKSKPPDVLDTDAERYKLTNLTIGEKDQSCAHETAAALRFHRAGLAGPVVASRLGISLHELKHEFQMGLDLEAAAGRLGLPIHDATLPKTAN